MYVLCAVPLVWNAISYILAVTLFYTCGGELSQVLYKRASLDLGKQGPDHVLGYCGTSTHHKGLFTMYVVAWLFYCCELNMTSLADGHHKVIAAHG